MRTDHMLLKAFAEAGDENAFAELVRRHAGVVRASISRRVRDRALAEDAVQAVFLVLAHRAAGLARSAGAEPQAGITGWLLKTARFAAVDIVRREAVRLRHERQACAARPLPPADGVEEQELVALDEALCKLAAIDRDALTLRYYQGASHAQIGIALGIGEEAARKRVTRGIKKLRQLMRRHGPPVSAAAVLLTASARQAAAAAGDVTLHPMPQRALALGARVVAAWARLQHRLAMAVATMGVVITAFLAFAGSREHATEVHTDASMLPPAVPGERGPADLSLREPHGPPTVRTRTLWELELALPRQRVVLALFQEAPPGSTEYEEATPAADVFGLIMGVTEAPAPDITPSTMRLSLVPPPRLFEDTTTVSAPRQELPWPTGTITTPQLVLFPPGRRHLPENEPPPHLHPTRIIAMIIWRNGAPH